MRLATFAGLVIVLTLVGCGGSQPVPPAATATAEASTAAVAPAPSDGPAFAITSPQSGASVSAETVLVSGTAAPNARIVQDIAFAEDQETTSNFTGSWTMSVALEPGVNDLTFRVGDDKASAITLSITRSIEAAASPNDGPADSPAPSDDLWAGVGLIPGANQYDITQGLKDRDFECSDMQITVSGAVQWSCKRDDGKVQYEVLISGEGPGRLHDVNPTAIFLNGQSAKMINADWFLPYIASLPYDGAKPATAKAWVEKHGAKGEIVIADVHFSLSGAKAARALHVFGDK